MPKTKTVDDEVDAMRQMSEALDPLTPEERGRVLRWAFERFGVPVPTGVGAARDGRKETERRDASENEPEDAGEFYARAAPTTEPERALVVAYWVQEIRGDGEFEAQPVNTQLKHMGHGVSNITRALDELKAQKPQLVIQIQKSGKSRQARKRYRVTGAGKAKVKELLSRPSEE